MSARNLLTDIAGVSVGHADDAALASGVTAIIFDKPAVASIDVRGGGPGTREDALLDPVSTVDAIDGIALAGGSAFGLEAGNGVQAWLAEQGHGFRIRDAVIPIVPGAICLRPLNGGNKAWGRFRHIAISLRRGCRGSSRSDFALGCAGAGLGATTANFKGGLGSASAATPAGVKVARARRGQRGRQRDRRRRPWFWAAPFEVGGEYAAVDCRPRSRPICSSCASRAARRQRAAESTTLSWSSPTRC